MQGFEGRRTPAEVMYSFYEMLLLDMSSVVSFTDSITRNCVCLTALWGEEDDRDEEGSVARRQKIVHVSRAI